MNRLQGIPGPPLIVSLNPAREPAPSSVLRVENFDHPVLDSDAMAAQRRLWSLQGEQRTWFCGAYFGAGFHEDGLQAGLAVAESIARVRRPWRVPNESGRIFVVAPEAVEQAA
jgi:predicted NAD/FAD-binding protein